MKKKSLPIIAIAAILGLASCGEARTSPTESGTASASTSEVSSSSAVQESTSTATSTATSTILPVEVSFKDLESTELEVGATLTLEVDVKNNVEDLPVAYSSSDEGILTVEDGVVTATGLGEATITVTVGEASDTLTLTTTMPSAMIGEWVGNDGMAYHELSIGKDGFVLDGEKLEVVETLTLTFTGFRAKVLIDDANCILEYYVSPFTGEIYVEMTMIGESSEMRLYKAGSVEDPYPPLPASWAGTYTGTRPVEDDTHVYTLVISSDGKATFDGKDVHCLACDQVGAATVSIEGEEYALAKLGDTIALSKTGEDFTLMLDKEEEGEQPEPGVYEPEDASWLGTWTDGTHTLIVNEQWNWSLDGEMADKVWKYESGEIVLQFNGAGNSVTRYYLERTLIEGVDTVVVSSLTMGQDDYWHLVKEAAPTIELPDGIVGTWKDASTGSTIVIGDDGSIAIDGEEAAFAGEFEEQHEGSFVVQVKIGGEEKTLEFNSAFGSIYLGYGSYKKVEEAAPAVELPDGIVGTWKSEDTGSVIVIGDDGSITIDGEPASFVSDFEEQYGSSFVADVEVGGETKTLEFNTAFGSIYFGWDAYKKVEETEEPEPTPAIELPDGIVGTWKDATTGSVIVIGDDGTITVDGEEASFVGEFEEQYAGSFVVQLEVGGETKTLEFNSAFGSIYLGYGSYKKVEEAAPAVELPDGIVGTWKDASTGSTIVIGDDGSIAIDGEEAAFAGEFEEQYEGSFVVKVEVGGETKTLEYNSAFGSIYLGYGSYKKVEETEEPTQTAFPAELIGTWTGTDTFYGGSMTLIIAEDGTVTYNGTVATSVTAYNEDTGLFTFVINGDQFRATVQEDVISHQTTITLSCLGGLTMVQGKLTKAA